MIDECCDKEYIEKLRNKIYRLQTENAQYREALYIACNKNQENIKISMALAESKMIKNGVLAMKFDEWWNEKALRYFAIIRENGSMSAERVVDLEQSCKRLACIAWRAAQPKWQPIETAPDRVPVILFIEGGILVGEKVSSNFWAVSPIYESYKIEPTTPTHWMPLPEPPGDVT